MTRTTVTELLESDRHVEVRTNRLVNDTMVGAYLTHFRERGSVHASPQAVLDGQLGSVMVLEVWQASR